MGTPVYYKFYLMKDDSTYYYLKDGAVLESADPKPLFNQPQEWDKTKISWARNEKYHGIFRTVTTTYSFTEDGATILRDLFYKFGYAAQCTFRVDQRTDTPSGYLYKTLYKGDVYFFDAEDVLTHFKVKILEGGLKSILKSNETTPYEIPIGEDALFIQYDGVFLRGKYNYKLSAADPVPAGFLSVPVVAGMFSLLTIPTTSEGNFPVAVANTAYGHPLMAISPTETVLNGTDTPYRDYAFEALQAMDITATYIAPIRWDAKNISATTVSLQFCLDIVTAKEDGAFLNRERLHTGTARTGFTGDQTFYEVIGALSPTLSIGTNERVYFLFFVLKTGVGTVDEYLVGIESEVDAAIVDINLSVVFRSATTFAKGYRHYQVWEKQISAMTGGAYTFRSDYLSNPATRAEQNYPYNTVLLPGDSLRQIENAKMQMQLDKLYKNASTMYPVGLGIVNDQVRVEELGFFYDRTKLIAHLGEVKDLKLSVYQEKIGTTLKIGYEFSETDTLNGRQDYNTATTWKFPITLDASKELNYVSPFKASTSQQEDIRINFSGKDNTNNEADNEIFVATINPAASLSATPPLVYYQLYRPEPDGTVSGIDFPATAYNVDISPGWNFRRLRGYFNSISYPITGNITFQKSERFSGLVSQFKTSPTTFSFNMAENASVPISTDDLIWLPIGAEFTSEVPIILNDLLEDDPYGYFEFTYYGKTYRVFMLDAAMEPSNNNTYNWKTILTPDNDIKQYIR